MSSSINPICRLCDIPVGKKEYATGHKTQDPTISHLFHNACLQQNDLQQRWTAVLKKKDDFSCGLCDKIIQECDRQSSQSALENNEYVLHLCCAKLGAAVIGGYFYTQGQCTIS